MKILVDIMSGDKAPLETLKGAAQAAAEFEHDIVFIGDENIIRSLAKEENIDIDRPNIQIVHTSEVITMEDTPLAIVREKKDCSMGIGLKMLAEGEGDAFVSAGNTGALHAGSTLIVRRIKGVQKSAIATILPYKNPTMLIDSGANIELKPEIYVQFARMGTIYMNKLFGIENPRVGLLNIGAEHTKGTKTAVEAFGLLSQAEDINFVGNVEGKELPFGACDILVTDGFTGNIVLKLTEGCASYIMKRFKEVLYANVLTKLSALSMKSGMMKLKEDFTASQYGGAPLLGLSKTVIKAHGSSDAFAVYNAVKQAIHCVESGIAYEIAIKTNPDFARSQKEQSATSSDESTEEKENG